MSAILKFDFQKREQLRFSEAIYLNYTKKTQFLHMATTFSLKQGETRTSHGPIPHPRKAHFKPRLFFVGAVEMCSHTHMITSITHSIIRFI